MSETPQILPADSYESALLLNERALDHYRATVERANGNQWSDIYAHTDGTRYGILYHADVEGAFDPAALAALEPLTAEWTVFAPEPEPLPTDGLNNAP